MITAAPTTARALLLVFVTGWILRGVYEWARTHFHVRPCVLCKSRFFCPKTCASFDPHVGVGACQNCDNERHLFFARPNGPIQCWACRREPNPETGA